MTSSSAQRHPAGTDRPTGAGARPIAWVDGRVIPASEATVPLTDNGFLRGDAVFDAMLVRGGRTHAADDHLARLRRSAQALDLRVPVLRQVVTDLLAAWGERDGILRIIVTRGGNVRGLLGPVPTPPSQSLLALEIPWGNALTGVKTLSYAVNVWAARQATKHGADDALIVNDGYVHELPTGAVCLVHGDRISAPDHHRLPVLDSITLAELRKVAEVVPSLPTLNDLRSADELFIVSAARPVVPVSHVLIDGGQLELPCPGPVTAELQTAFADHISTALDPRA